MKTVVLALAAVAVLAATSARAACYSVYQGPALVFRSVLTPVDLSRRLHETVPRRFGPGTSMVIADGSDACAAFEEPTRAARGSAAVDPRRPSAGRARSAGAQRYFEANSTAIRSQVGGTP